LPALEDHEMDEDILNLGRKKRIKSKGFKKAFNGQSTLYGGLPGKDDFKMPIIKSS
jgi:hypothetical protein